MQQKYLICHCKRGAEFFSAETERIEFPRPSNLIRVMPA